MPDPELVMLVDEDNNPVLDNDGKMVGAPRQEVVDNKLWHRSSCIFITDEEGNFYVQKRTKTKLYYPGYFDLMTGGVMDLQDLGNDMLNAEREMQEELGLAGVQMEFLETSKYIGEDGHKFFCNIYLAKIDSKNIKFTL